MKGKLEGSEGERRGAKGSDKLVRWVKASVAAWTQDESFTFGSVLGRLACRTGRLRGAKRGKDFSSIRLDFLTLTPLPLLHALAHHLVTLYGGLRHGKKT